MIGTQNSWLWCQHPRQPAQTKHGRQLKPALASAVLTVLVATAMFSYLTATTVSYQTAMATPLLSTSVNSVWSLSAIYPAGYNGTGLQVDGGGGKTGNTMSDVTIAIYNYNNEKADLTSIQLTDNKSWLWIGNVSYAIPADSVMILYINGSMNATEPTITLQSYKALANSESQSSQAFSQAFASRYGGVEVKLRTANGNSATGYII